MRFSQFKHVKGPDSWKIVDFPQPHSQKASQPLQVGLRVLEPGLDDEVDRLAEAYSKSQGVEKYDDVHPICVKARMVYTLALACVDPSSDPRRPIPFFCDEPYSADNHTVERAAEIIRTGIVSTPEGELRIGMTPDIVVYLNEQYEVYRDEVHPQALTLKDSELAEATRKAAESADFLLSLRPGMRLRLQHFMASLAVAALEIASGNSITSTSDTTKKLSGSSKSKKASKAHVKNR